MPTRQPAEPEVLGRAETGSTTEVAGSTRISSTFGRDVPVPPYWSRPSTFGVDVLVLLATSQYFCTFTVLPYPSTLVLGGPGTLVRYFGTGRSQYFGTVRTVRRYRVLSNCTYSTEVPTAEVRKYRREARCTYRSGDVKNFTIDNRQISRAHVRMTSLSL